MRSSRLHDISLGNGKTLSKLPVIDIYGPVYQGEGCLVGQQTHFLRLGGCDYRCSWCDTMYAVDPKLVKEHKTDMVEEDILHQLKELAHMSNCMTVTLSGGNPCIHDLGKLMAGLKVNGFVVALETQGSIWRPWVADCDIVTVSPKPPSSGMVTSDDRLTEFLTNLRLASVPEVCLKIVIADNTDLKWATELVLGYRPFCDYTSCYFQPMTNVPLGLKEEMGRVGYSPSTEQILDDTCSLMGLMMKDPRLSHVRIMPQLHALLFGQQRRI